VLINVLAHELERVAPGEPSRSLPLTPSTCFVRWLRCTSAYAARTRSSPSSPGTACGFPRSLRHPASVFRPRRRWRGDGRQRVGGARGVPATRSSAT
jgi:hypothetical protein